MKKIKENAATMLLVLFCVVFLVPSLILTSCTNGEDGFLVTRPLPPEKIYITETDTMWKDTTIIIERIEIQGLKADGTPSLDKVDDTKYRTDYPVIEDGKSHIPNTNLIVSAKVGEKKDVVVISQRNIGRPSFEIGQRTVKEYTEGDFYKVSFDAEWRYSWESANNFTQSVYTMHEMAWYKKFLQMLSSSWNVNFERIGLQAVGREYVHNGVEGTLYTDTLVWTASYYKNDVRKLVQTQDFFLGNEIIEPDPEAEKLFGKDFKFETISDNLAQTSFVLWEKLNDGSEKKLADLSATLEFSLVNAEGVTIDVNEFSLSNLKAVEGSKKTVGEPKAINGISIQKYVTTYTTKTDKSESVFYAYTEEAIFLNSDELGGNIKFLSKDFSFQDKGTSTLQDLESEGNYQRKQSTTSIVATYHDRNLNGTGVIILRKKIDTSIASRIGKDFKFKTISDSRAETSFSLYEVVNERETLVGSKSATLEFSLVNAEGVTIDVNEFSLSNLKAVEGSKKTVGEPKVINGISIQKYVTTYTTKTDKSESVFYAYTEEAIFLNSDELGGNIKFLSKDFYFQDKGTSALQDMATEGNYQRKQSTTSIVATYHDRNLNGTGVIILRKVKGTDPAPDKVLERLVEKSYDGNKTYVITRFYTDKTYSDTTVINEFGYPHKIVMPILEKRLNRDNTEFGRPTISKKGSATKIDDASKKGNLIFQSMSQNMNSAYTGHSHVIEQQYTALEYTEGGKSCDLSVPMWDLNHNQNALGNLRQEVENNKNFDVTPVSFKYNAAFGNAASSIENTDTEVWIDKGAISSEIGQAGKDLGFDYVNETTSYAFATFYSIMSDNSEKLLGVDGVNVFNSVEIPSGQSLDVTDFNVTDAQAISGSKQFVGQREATGKFGGKFLVKKYRTLYTTKTNKTEVAYILYHEEAEYIPTKGAGFPMIFKFHEVTDLGMSALTSLGRINGKDGMRYDSQITASFNNRSGSVLKSEVQLWMKSDNKNGIDIAWTLANGGMTHTWDYANTHHISAAAIWNNSDNIGGVKGTVDGIEVAKATWDQVNAPTGRISLAQEANGTWTICQVSESVDKKGWVWRSLMKGDNNRAVTSISNAQLLTQGTTEVYIISTAKENEDHSVTISSAKGSITVGAW